jgi:hypothetical protein
MKGIGIVGAGVAGLQLALRLQQHGVPVTLYSDRTPDQVRAGRLPSTVCRFAPTRERERALSITRWDDPALATFGINLQITGTPIAFRGSFSRPASFLDMRVYQATLLEDVAAAGVQVVFGTVEPAAVVDLSRNHSLMVVATGRGQLAEMFARLPERSPYAEPQRRLFAGLFHGITMPDPPVMSFSVAPGHGEVFNAPFHSFDGPVSALLVEAVPGGDLEPLTHANYPDNPAGFRSAVLDGLRVHAPEVFERVNQDAFDLTGPRDMHRGAIVPVVRRGYAALDTGVYAQAIGDAHILNDPILGQGANAASHAAWTLADAILGGGPFDASFCRQVEQKIWSYARNVSEWSNAFLQPPPDHVLELFGAANENAAIADELVDIFAAPQQAWAIFGSAPGAAAFLRGFEREAA